MEPEVFEYGKLQKAITTEEDSFTLCQTSNVRRDNFQFSHIFALLQGVHSKVFSFVSNNLCIVEPFTSLLTLVAAIFTVLDRNNAVRALDLIPLVRVSMVLSHRLQFIYFKVANAALSKVMICLVIIPCGLGVEGFLADSTKYRGYQVISSVSLHLSLGSENLVTLITRMNGILRL